MHGYHRHFMSYRYTGANTMNASDTSTVYLGTLGNGFVSFALFTVNWQKANENL